MNRRHFLRSGFALATAGLAPAAQAVPFVAPEKPPKHFILLWMEGGLSHLDIWDIKEGSPNQGDFKSIPTAVEGIRISELMPTVAKEFKNLSVIRTLCSREADRARATYRMTHVYPPSALGVQYPGVGSIVGYLCGTATAPVPRCVTIGGDPGFGDAGPLGPTFAGFPVISPGMAPENIKTPNMGDPQTTQGRAERRRDLLGILDKQFADDRVPHLKEAERDQHRDAAQSLKEVHDLAWEYSRLAPKHFEFTAEENAQLQERFGNGGFGRGCLVAAKLVKAGAAAVSVTRGGWDMHGNLANALPPAAAELDRGFGGLMAELRETGLIGETLVLCAGPFGRSPRINQNAGRVPWANGWSVVLGGCGIGGVEYGKMDKDGMIVERNPVSVEQLYATVYTALGIDLKDPQIQLRDSLGRPFHLTGEKENARPIKELLGTAKG